jgi:hypothetical protein
LQCLYSNLIFAVSASFFCLPFSAPSASSLSLRLQCLHSNSVFAVSASFFCLPFSAPSSFRLQ